ncbi:MAG: lipid-A-disaccharide synthase, partial [Paracoccaceae bacterium]
MIRLFLLAGEPSGDKLGAALMAGLTKVAGKGAVGFLGVGGDLMQAQGMRSLFEMSELSVMGYAEVIPKYPALKRRMEQTVAEVLRQKPDALITIDSPDFCLRVARRVRAVSDLRTIHYVAPSVWAWRPGRAAKMARYIDHVLALLPFEPPLMQAAGMTCDFVGHPVAGEPPASQSERRAFANIYGTADKLTILVLPGSRRSEVARLAPVFGKALEVVLARHPDAKIVVPVTANVAHDVLQACTFWPGTPIVLDPRALPAAEAETRKRIAFDAADVALAASGTVSLELAASNTPMVIGYDMSWLSWQIMSRLSRVDTVTLVNIIDQSRG